MAHLITGDSHIAALSDGYTELEKKSESIIDCEFKPIGFGQFLRGSFYSDGLDSVDIPAQKMSRGLKGLSKSGSDFGFVGVSGPLHSLRIWRSNWSKYSTFEFRSSNIDRPHSVSVSLLNAIIERDLKNLISFISLLKKYYPVFVIDAPGPFRTNPSIDQSGSDFVFYLISAYRRKAISSLVEIGVPIVFCDESWFDADGFMLESFRSGVKGDYFHGNAIYGSLMMSRVNDFLADRIC